MIGNNMPLDDLLTDLGRWGNVDLSFKWGKWHCEVRVPGYTFAAPIMAYQRASATTPAEACNQCFELLEEWRATGEMAKDRNRYLEQHNLLIDHYDNAGIYRRTGFNAVRHPGQCEPERPLPRTD